jgi:uncharacterized protein YecE (DUF72 family)
MIMMIMHDIHIGTSGWNYESFVKRLYPPGTPKRKYLEIYSSQLLTVELNASFYRSFPQSTWEGWYRRTPPDFLWSVKAPRFFTHIRRLNISQDSINRFWNDIKPLRDKMGVALFQLPPSLKFDKDLLTGFLAMQPSGTRISLEARHPSWHEPQVWDLLTEQNVAWVVSDTTGHHPMSLKITADFAYVRLHGTHELYHGLYGEKMLSKWLSTIREWGVETFIYFDNTDDGSAATDALLFQKMLEDKQRA